MFMNTNKLLFQAPDTVAVYMNQALEEIDKTFGEGFAKKNPTLVVAFITACTVDYNTAIMSNKLDNIAYALSSLSVK